MLSEALQRQAATATNIAARSGDHFAKQKAPPHQLVTTAAASGASSNTAAAAVHRERATHQPQLQPQQPQRQTAPARNIAASGREHRGKHEPPPQPLVTTAAASGASASTATAAPPTPAPAARKQRQQQQQEQEEQEEEPPQLQQQRQQLQQPQQQQPQQHQPQQQQPQQQEQLQQPAAPNSSSNLEGVSFADIARLTGGIVPSMDEPLDIFFTEEKMSVASNELQTVLEDRATEILTACGVNHRRFRVEGQMPRSGKEEKEKASDLFWLPMMRLTDRAQLLRNFAAERGMKAIFHAELEKQHPQGPYQVSLQDTIDAVSIAAARSAGRDLVPPREVLHRSFLERHTHDSTQLKKLICAMLDSESACGGSKVLLSKREKFLRFFDPKCLPDPTHMGYHHLGGAEWANKFGSSLRFFYHHVSEKHSGELIQIVRQVLPFESEHPECDIFSAGRDLVPAVHSSQFFSNDSAAEALRRATSHFKDKWWRDDAARGASEARRKFITSMRPHANNVWQPTSPAGFKSNTALIVFHSLDSLVWDFIQRTDIDDVTFADLYHFFCRCPLLAYKRTHSTSGKGSAASAAEISQNTKGKNKGKEF